MNHMMTESRPKHIKEKAQLERKHKAEIARMKNIVETQTREAVKSAARAVLIDAGCRSDAIDDIASIIASKTTFNSAGKATIWDEDNMKNLSPEAFARKYIANHEYLQAGHHGSGQVPPAHKTWDFARALKDVHYNNEWEKVDPEGNQKAWDEHMAKVNRQ